MGNSSLPAACLRHSARGRSLKGSACIDLDDDSPGHWVQAELLQGEVSVGFLEVFETLRWGVGRVGSRKHENTRLGKPMLTGSENEMSRFACFKQPRRSIFEGLQCFHN